MSTDDKQLILDTLVAKTSYIDGDSPSSLITTLDRLGIGWARIYGALDELQEDGRITCLRQGSRIVYRVNGPLYVEWTRILKENPEFEVKVHAFLLELGEEKRGKELTQKLAELKEKGAVLEAELQAVRKERDALMGRK